MTRLGPTPMFLAYHRTCGHGVGICNSRSAALAVIDVLPPRIRYGMRIRSNPTQEEIVAVMAGRRCSTCDIAIAMREATSVAEQPEE